MEVFLNLIGVTTPALQAATLQGLLSFFGVLVTGLVAIWTWRANKRSERSDRERLRSEKKQDTQRALWAEIDALWRQLYLNGAAEDHIALAKASFAEAANNEEGYTPFVASVAGLRIVEVLTADIALLDADEIASIARLVRQLHAIDELARDMRTEQFIALSADRKLSMLVHYLRMLGRCEHWAEQAISKLETGLAIAETDVLAKRKANLEAERYRPPLREAASINKTASAQTRPEPASGEPARPDRPASHEGSSESP